MRALLATLAVVFGAILSGCPGSVIQPLPTGFGPGVYAGQFETENESGDFANAGTLSLTVGNAGQVSGTGEVLGRSVQIVGLLDGDGLLDGTITDTLSQFSGRFDGQLAGSVLSGSFRLPQPEGDDTTGVWDAQLQQ